MTAKKVTNLWIPYRKPSSHSRLRLFCFPYAGGSASVFRDWFNFFPPEIDICAIQYPGRERRMNEPQFTSLPPLVDMLAEALLPELDIPFAFLGHSLGALISFELARLFQKKGITPIHLFVSSYRAPTIQDKEDKSHLLPDNEFVEKLYKHNGTPASVLENRELMNLLLPTIRADFAISETYVYSPSVLLNCPISAYGGIADPDVKYDDLKSWEEQTINSFNVRMFPGDHFYIRNKPEGIINSILKELLTNRGSW